MKKPILITSVILLISLLCAVGLWINERDKKYVVELLNAFRSMQIASETLNIPSESMTFDTLKENGYLSDFDFENITKGYEIQYFADRSADGISSPLMLRATKEDTIIEVPRQGPITIHHQ